MTVVNLHVGVQKRDGFVYYFNGMLPFYRHRSDDRASLKHVVCQMLCTNLATRAQLSDALQIPARSISRWLVRFKEEGEDCFFIKKK